MVTKGQFEKGLPQSDLERSQRRRSVPYRLRALTERTHEAAAHTLAVAEPRFICDLFDGKAALFEHEPGCFQPKVLDGFGRGYAGLRAEHAAELPRAKASRFRQLLDRQRRRQVAPRQLTRNLHPIQSAIHIQY